MKVIENGNGRPAARAMPSLTVRRAVANAHAATHATAADREGAASAAAIAPRTAMPIDAIVVLRAESTRAVVSDRARVSSSASARSWRSWFWRSIAVKAIAVEASDA